MKCFGRYINEIINNKNIMFFTYSNSGFEIMIDVKNIDYKFEIKLFNKLINKKSQFIKVYIDGELETKIELKETNYSLPILNLNEGKHIIKVIKINEIQYSRLGLIGFEFNNVDIVDEEKNNNSKIEFYGDSVTCGFGILSNAKDDKTLMEDEDSSISYASLASEKLGFDFSLISYSGISLTDKLNISGVPFDILSIFDTSNLVNKWDFNNFICDYVVINLGTNDDAAYKSLNKQNEKLLALNSFKEKYIKFIDVLKSIHKNAQIICVSNVMNVLHQDIIDVIKDVVNKENIKHSNSIHYLELVPNNDGALTHPSKEAHKINADILADFVKSISK